MLPIFLAFRDRLAGSGYDWVYSNNAVRFILIVDIYEDSREVFLSLGSALGPRRQLESRCGRPGLWVALRGCPPFCPG
jgi:hypothetical protein